MTWPEAFALSVTAVSICWLIAQVIRAGASRPSSHESNARIIETLVKRKPMEWSYTWQPSEIEKGLREAAKPDPKAKIRNEAKP